MTGKRSRKPAADAPERSGKGSAPLTGQVALVTGAGKRVGRAIAVALAAAGARVAVHFNGSIVGAHESVRMIRAAGGEASVFRSDLSRAGRPSKLVTKVARECGRLDLLVNSAASMKRTPLRSVREPDWDAVFALNLRAPFFCAIEAARAMGRKGGVIINIGDHMAFESWPEFVPHSVSKAGVAAMTGALAAALAPRVRVNAVVPGFVLAPDTYPAARRRAFAAATPLKRIGSPGDVAAAVVYLASAAYVTGETLFVDGGRHGAR